MDVFKTYITFFRLGKSIIASILYFGVMFLCFSYMISETPLTFEGMGVVGLIDSIH